MEIGTAAANYSRCLITGVEAGLASRPPSLASVKSGKTSRGGIT